MAKRELKVHFVPAGQKVWTICGMPVRARVKGEEHPYADNPDAVTCVNCRKGLERSKGLEVIGNKEDVIKEGARPLRVVIEGARAAGKTVLANKLARELAQAGHAVRVVDGTNVRHMERLRRMAAEDRCEWPKIATRIDIVTRDGSMEIIDDPQPVVHMIEGGDWKKHWCGAESGPAVHAAENFEAVTCLTCLRVMAGTNTARMLSWQQRAEASERLGGGLLKKLEDETAAAKESYQAWDEAQREVLRLREKLLVSTRAFEEITKDLEETRAINKEALSREGDCGALVAALGFQAKAFAIAINHGFKKPL